MRILRSTPFVLLYISVAILVAGCVLGGMEEKFEPFEIWPLAMVLMALGSAFVMFTGYLAFEYAERKIKNGKIDEEDDDGD